MAKGNLFLGTAARSVGDVVMYRREGSQVSRVRVRKIANPKTDAQCEQRAFMSAVVKFYQPLANVLDRSWQGLSRAKSYAKFLKTNVGIVRAGGFYIPKDFGFVPLPLQISNGTLMQSTLAIKGTDVSVDLERAATAEDVGTTVAKISTLLIERGLQQGDVLTFIAAAQEEGDPTKLPYFVVADQFEIDTNNNANIDTVMHNIYCGGAEVGEVEFNFSYVGNYSAGIGFVVARNVDGVWQRTKSFFSIKESVTTRFTGDVAKAAAIASYKGAAASDNPLVYLDGEEL